MSGGAGIEPVVIGAVLAFAGAGIARQGWQGLRLRAAAPVPGAELPASPPPGTSTGWKLFYGAMLLFGAFVFVCGLLLALSIFLSE